MWLHCCTDLAYIFGANMSQLVNITLPAFPALCHYVVSVVSSLRMIKAADLIANLNKGHLGPIQR
jgi:hypothetical protein